MLIDSQIWIYYIDPNASENKCVTSYLDGNEDDGILFNEKIIINPVIPMEVGHTIFGNPQLDIVLSFETITSIFHFENIEIKEIDQETLMDGLNILAKYRSKGIGGRDALLMATMMKFNISTIVTNDKSLLNLKELRRIDPIFSPPLILDIGKNFDDSDYKDRLLKQYSK